MLYQLVSLHMNMHPWKSLTQINCFLVHIEVEARENHSKLAWAISSEIQQLIYLLGSWLVFPCLGKWDPQSKFHEQVDQAASVSLVSVVTKIRRVSHTAMALHRILQTLSGTFSHWNFLWFFLMAFSKQTFLCRMDFHCIFPVCLAFMEYYKSLCTGLEKKNQTT